MVEETSDKERSSPEPAFETISNETVFEELTLGMSMEDVRKLHPTASVGGGARVKNVISTLPDGRSIVAKFLDGRLGIIVAKTKVKAGDAAEVDAAFQRALAVHAKRFGMPPPGGVGKKSMIWTEGNISLMVRKDEKFGEVIEEFRDVTASVQIRNIENR
ncbi:MAG TPA: hypothetical protein PL033_07540 [Candidatus Brocadiia bacterium]|nr:hypothetical protein [Candidatus Brocadiia bacterium]